MNVVGQGLWMRRFWRISFFFLLLDLCCKTWGVFNLSVLFPDHVRHDFPSETKIEPAGTWNKSLWSCSSTAPTIWNISEQWVILKGHSGIPLPSPRLRRPILSPSLTNPDWKFILYIQVSYIRFLFRFSRRLSCNLIYSWEVAGKWDGWQEELHLIQRESVDE